jgi:hypothetical protein
MNKIGSVNRSFIDFLNNSEALLDRLTEEQFWDLASCGIEDGEEKMPPDVRQFYAIAHQHGYNTDDLVQEAREGEIMAQVLMATIMLASFKKSITFLPIIYKLLKKGLEQGDYRAEQTAEIANEVFAKVSEHSSAILKGLERAIDLIKQLECQSQHIRVVN